MSNANNAGARAADVCFPMQYKLTAQDHRERVVTALRADANPTDASLLRKLERCGVDWANRYPCRSPACHPCRRRNIRRQQRESFRWFDHLSNAELAFVTVTLGATEDINGVTSMIKKSRKDTKNRFDAARRRDERWNEAYLMAWHEIDALGTVHMPLLGYKRRSLLTHWRGVGADVLAATWVPTWHGILRLNGLSLTEVKTELGKQWQINHQVEVRPFNPVRTLQQNLMRLTSYSNKFHCMTNLDGPVGELWPMRWQAQFFGWLDSAQRNSFESLRMTILPSYADNDAVDEAVGSSLPMPFIHSFSGVPMPYNTGGFA